MFDQIAIEIVEHEARSAGSHETVQRFFKKSGRGIEHDLMRQIAPDSAPARGWVVWFADPGEEQQARVAKRPRREKKQVRGLKVFLAGSSRIEDTAGFAALRGRFVNNSPHCRI